MTRSQRSCDARPPLRPPRRSPGRVLRRALVCASRALLIPVFLLSNARLVTIDAPATPAAPLLHHSTALLLITHSRPHYLNVSLTSVLRYHPRTQEFPLVVSRDQQDGEHAHTDRLVEQFARRAQHQGVPFYTWAHAKCYAEPADEQPAFVDTTAYRRITRHYYWALSTLFSTKLAGRPIDRVIILEDDMEVASDMFEYFKTFTPMLESDPSLFCISAWNDNGIDTLNLNNSQFHRTDFFPGLGWMLTRAIWNELQPKWPPIYWDDWVRHPEQTKHRHCIRPEVSRTANFGEKGVSQSFHFQKHVSKVVLSRQAVDFSRLNLSYLHVDQYDQLIFGRMRTAVQLRFSNYLTSRPQHSDVIAFYPDDNMDAISRRTGIMGDHRNGVRRTSYKGVVVIPWNGYWAFIVSRSWRPPPGVQLEGPLCC